jgi:two-component system sensor kinase FixL
MEQTIDDALRVPKWAAPIGWITRSAWKAAALSIAYIALYLTLDRLSFIGPLHGVGITPWSPSTGVAITLLIIKGLRYAPLVMVAELVSGAVLPMAAIPLTPVFLGALMVTAGYTGAAAMLRHAGFEAGIRGSSDVVLLLIVTIISSGLVATGFVASYAFAGVVPWRGFGEAVFQFWIGDAIGIVSLLPPLLLLKDRFKEWVPRVREKSPLQLVEGAAQAASIVGALAAVFLGMGGDHPLGLFYLLFLPLIWIAARHGLRGASWSVLAIQIGLIVGLDIQGHPEPVLRAFQLLMFALASTGLMLGAVVTERRRLLLALVDSEEHRAAILNTVPDGVLMINSHGIIRSINPAVERLFSRPSHWLVGHDIAELVEGGPDLLDRLKLAARSPISALACWELDACRADGSKFPVELSAGRFDLLGVEHYTVVIRDITSRRTAEVRFREHQAELAHVSRVSLAGEMAAGIAHELSQPLTAVTAYARGCLRLLAESVSEPAVLQEGIQEVVQQAERAGDVLDRLREFVRGGEYRRAATEVEILIDAVMGLTRMEAMQRGVEIEKRTDPNLPAVLTDRVQIEQVLVNLLRNAMDAMDAADCPRRLIVISAQRNSGHAVEISVTDSGPGVAAEVTDTIFEPFVTTKSNGMGMGLSISRSIVDSHGGRLRMAHDVPSGAMFIFDLPTAEIEASSHAG